MRRSFWRSCLSTAKASAKVDDWRPTADVAALRLRAELNQLIRTFFAERQVLEVETPILSRFGTTDRHIESFDTALSNSQGRAWLRTSPEFALKRLLAAGVGDCYELGRVFRRGEVGRRHNPEFSMLEWYRLGWDEQRLIEEVQQLIVAALGLVGRRCRFEKCSYAELFERHLNVNPHTASVEQLQALLTDHRIQADGLERDDWLDLVFSLLLQPQFAEDCLLAVYDYPGSQCALARIRDTGPYRVAERFECYLGPLELCNGYHELLDADEQTARFAADIAWREQVRRPGPPADEALLRAMRHGLPACAGVALGVDRLLACLLGSTDLADAIAFPWR